MCKRVIIGDLLYTYTINRLIINPRSKVDMNNACILKSSSGEETDNSPRGDTDDNTSYPAQKMTVWQQ